MGRRTLLVTSMVLGMVLPADGGPAVDQRKIGPRPVLRLRIGDVELSQRNHAARAVAPSNRHVLQLRGPLTAEQRKALSGVGVVLEDYLPQYAYLVDLAAADREAVARLDFVGEVSPFLPEWKIDPVLAVLTEDAARTYRHSLNSERLSLLDAGKVQVIITTFRGTDVVAAVDALAALSGLEVYGGTQVAERAIIDVAVPLDGLGDLADVPFVQFAEDAPRGTLRNSTTTRVVQSGTNTETPVWDRGLHGENQIIGLIDATPDLGHCMFTDTEPVGPTHRKVVALRPSSPPPDHSHGTMVAGVLAGDNAPWGEPNGRDGVALAARFSYSDFFAVDDKPSTLLPRLVDAHNDGARVHSNSWGDDSTTAYTTWCNQIDQFSYDYEDDLVCFAASNYSTLHTPENAKNVLAVGASSQYPDHNNRCAGGRGPTFDGRRKPEVYAPGCSIRSAAVNTSCSTTVGSGTSYSCPAIAAAAALVRQYYVEGFYPTGDRQTEDELIPSGALMKATLLNAAVDMTGVTGYPSTREGWGRLVLDRGLYFTDQTRRLAVRDLRNAEGLTTGESAAFDVTVWGELHDLRVTLVFTEPAAVVNASDPVINNLDLVVTGPPTGIAGGNVFRGNYFKNGQSVAGGTLDTRNNVEQVYLPSPTVGAYTIEVLATEVNSLNPQGYAVVVSGQVIEGAYDPPPGYADSDADGDHDLADFAAFQSCFSSTGEPYTDPACAVFDIDGDANVDGDDFEPFRAVLTGPQ